MTDTPFGNSSFFSGFAVAPQRGVDLENALIAATASTTAAQIATDAAAAAASTAQSAALSASGVAAAAVTTINAAVTSGTNTINTAASTATTTITGSVATAVSSASGSATAAAASATAAGTSQTAAAGSATAAAGSATTAAGSATAAAGSATTAGTSQTAAAGSATAAGISATSAAGSATAAAASAASVNLPSMTGQGLNMLRANSGATSFEYRTPAQVLSDIGALGTSAAASTYLTQSNAASTYLTISNASSTYAPKTSAVLTTATVAADPATALGVASKQYVDNSVAQTLELGRHRIQNGLFRINQRGLASVTATGGYPVDRWQHSDAGAGTRSLAQYTMVDADRTAIGDQDAVFGLTIITAGSAGASDLELVSHKIEGARAYANKTVTISFFAVATAASKSISLELVQSFGTGGSPAAAVTGIGAIKFALTTGWARYSTTISVPSVAGKTFGSNGDDFLSVNFWTSAGSSFNARTGSLGQQSSTITLWGIQDDLGSIAGMIDKPNLRHELADCQRFYQLVDVHALLVASAASNYACSPGALSPTMRASPTLAAFATLVADTNVASFGVDTATPRGFRAFAITTAAGIVSFDRTISATADL